MPLYPALRSIRWLDDLKVQKHQRFQTGCISNSRYLESNHKFQTCDLCRASHCKSNDSLKVSEIPNGIHSEIRFFQSVLYCEKHGSQLNPPTKIPTIMPSKTNPCFVPGSLNRGHGRSDNNFDVKKVANIWWFLCHYESSHRAFWYEPARLNRSFPVGHRERTNWFLVWIETWNANRFRISIRLHKNQRNVAGKFTVQ